jgi:hypothetical protein
MNEQQIQEIAANFSYPPTPDIAVAVRRRLAVPMKRPPWRVQRRLAWAVVALLVVLAGSLAVPQVRAAVLRIFRAGAITIFVPEATATAVPPTSTAPAQLQAPPAAMPEYLIAQDVLLELAGETTLAEAQAKMSELLLIPEGWPPPDRVYYQDHDWPAVVIFVWLEPGSTDEVRLALYQIDEASFAYKQAERVEEVTVNGRQAFWIEGEHWLQLQDGTMQPWLFVEGSVLVWWAETGTTFRLESGLSLAEAKEIAESLVLLPEKE